MVSGYRSNPSSEVAYFFASAGGVALTSGTTFLHIIALARLTGRTLGVASVTYQRSENELGKTYCDRMTQGNSKEGEYLIVQSWSSIIMQG